MALAEAKRIPQLGLFGAHRSNHLTGAASAGFKGSIVALDTADANLLKVGAASTTLIAIGTSLEDFVAADLNIEIEAGIQKVDNSATAAITNADIGKVCFIEDDETASRTDQAGTLSPLGIVVAVDPDDSNPFVWIGPFVPTSGGAAVASASLPSLHGVRIVSTADRALTGLAAIDGVTPVAGDRVLLKDQASGEENGIYVAAAGAWTRATDADSNVEIVPGMLVGVSEGTVGADEFWFLATNAPITVDTTALVFTQLPSLSDLAGTGSADGATLVGYNDGGGFTTAADVDAALDEIYQDRLSTQHIIRIPLNEFIDVITAAGTPLTLFIGAGELPGFSLADSEAMTIRWNNDADPDQIQASVAMPQDLDETKDMTIHYLVSKTGATVGDAVTFTSNVLWVTDGALHDADTFVVDTSTAIVGDDAAKTATEIIATIANADIPASPSAMQVKINPTDGLLGTDDLHLHAVWLEYTPKILTS